MSKEMETRIAAALTGVRCDDLTRLLESVMITNGAKFAPKTADKYSRVLIRYIQTLSAKGRVVELSNENIDWYMQELLNEVGSGGMRTGTLHHHWRAFRTLLIRIGRKEDALITLDVKRFATARCSTPMTTAERETLLARRKERERLGTLPRRARKQ